MITSLIPLFSRIPDGNPVMEAKKNQLFGVPKEGRGVTLLIFKYI